MLNVKNMKCRAVWNKKDQETVISGIFSGYRLYMQSKTREKMLHISSSERGEKVLLIGVEMASSKALFLALFISAIAFCPRSVDANVAESMDFYWASPLSSMTNGNELQLDLDSTSGNFFEQLV